jgi:hypothetical protein
MCQDSLYYQNFDSDNLCQVLVEEEGARPKPARQFTCIDLAFILPGDFNVFEIVAATALGDVYHGCFEFDESENTLKGFEPKLRKVLDGGALGYQTVRDLKLIKLTLREGIMQPLVLLSTLSHLYQFTDDCRLENLFEKYSDTTDKPDRLAVRHAIKLDDDNFSNRTEVQILISYRQGTAYGVGWVNSSGLMWAKLGTGVLKRKQFNQVSYTCDAGFPLSCHLTQFHAFFVYQTTISVVSLVNQQPVYITHQIPLVASGLSFDQRSQHFLLFSKQSPVMVAHLLDDSIDAWKQFLNLGKVEEAHSLCESKK